MRVEQTAVKCAISRGGFSAERVFSIALPDGDRHVGVALLDYCLDRNWKPFNTDQPPPGQVIDGMVAARVLKDNGNVLIHIPDGEVIEVDAALVVSKEKPHVPVES